MQTIDVESDLEREVRLALDMARAIWLGDDQRPAEGIAPAVAYLAAEVERLRRWWGYGETLQVWPHPEPTTYTYVEHGHLRRAANQRARSNYACTRCGARGRANDRDLGRVYAQHAKCEPSAYAWGVGDDVFVTEFNQAIP